MEIAPAGFFAIGCILYQKRQSLGGIVRFSTLGKLYYTETAVLSYGKSRHSSDRPAFSRTPGLISIPVIPGRTIWANGHK